MKKTKVLLSREDWIEAAIDELSVSGFRGVAVEPLARRLNISKGSFYWHFRDLKELVAAVLDAWKQRGFEDVIANLRTIRNPQQRLAALIHTAWGNRRDLRAESALVSEALAGNKQVIPVIEEVTAGRLEYLRSLYREMGLPASEATQWAVTAYSAYVGLVQLVALKVKMLKTEAAIRALATQMVSILVPAKELIPDL